MKIGIELRQVTFGASGGLAQYLQGTLAAAFANYPQHQFVVFCTIFNRSLLGDVPGNVTIHTLPAFGFFQKIDQAAAGGEIEVLFRSFPMEAPLLMSWDRQIMLIPDLQHDAYPEFFTAEVLRLRRLAFHQAMARAGALLAFTDYVRGTILSHPWNRCRNIFLSAPALTLGHDRTGELRPEEQLLIPTEDFFFYPANLWPHKNHRRVLQALADLRWAHRRRIRLILTGHPEGFEKLQAEFPEAAVTHLGFVREPLMQALLARAKALAFFSLHEGFGIPLLEAFHAGTPVICSNLTSLPQVGGDAILSCDPRDVQAISGLMERILSDEPLRQSLIARGRARLSHYTWEAAAAGLIQAAEHAVRDTMERLPWSPPPVIRGRVRVGAEFIGKDQPPPQPSPGLPEEGEDKPPMASRTAEYVNGSETASLEINEPPLVSIVTPSFNQGRYLKATIESVLSQSYPHVQYTVMDGGSTDESVAILKSYGERFVWKSEKDNGQCDAINKGMSQAKGSILAFLNSDDILLPGAIERIVRHFGENPDCDMVYGNANYLDEAGNVTGRYKTAEYSFQRLMTDCCVCQPAAFWRSRIAGLIGPLDESLHCALDYDYWLRMDRAGGRICHIHDFLAGSRLHAETKTMSLREKFYQEIFAVCMKNGGYVDYNYFLGLWHHRVTESPSGWPHWFRWLPGAYFPMAHIHYTRFELDRIGPKSAAWQMANSIIFRAARLPLAGRLISQARAESNGCCRRLGSADSGRITGWNRARIVVRPRACGQRLRHVGIPPVDMKVMIFADNKILGSYSLAAGKSQTIGEDICLDSSRPVTLGFRFSHHVTDAARRKLSFLVTETNLFGENDLA